MLIGHHNILWSPYEVAAYYTLYAKIENEPYHAIRPKLDACHYMTIMLISQQVLISRMTYLV
jgi:hypothetical protein